MNNPLRICITLDSRSTGGIETHVLHQASALMKAGLTVAIVFVEDHGNHPLLEALHMRGIQARFMDGRISTLRRFFRQWGADLVHSHGYRASILSRIATLFIPVRHFGTYHAGDRHRGKLGLYDWIDRHTAFMSAHTFCVSQEIATRLPVRTTVLDNFIDLPEVAQKCARQIAFVGRLSHEKGPDRLLELTERLPGLRIHVYG